MKRHVLCLVFSLCTMALSAMIETLSLHELVSRSECIAVVRIEESGILPDVEKGSPNNRTIMAPLNILKGSLNASGSIFVDTFKNEAGGFVEDQVSFPEPGKKALVFLRKGPGEAFFVVNGIQGVWAMRDADDKLLGMGFKYTLDDVLRESRK